MYINPTLDRIIVKKCEFEEVYTSKIILTDNTKKDINRFVYDVIKVGPGGVVDDIDIQMYITVGDKVIIPEYIGSEIQIDGIDYRIVKQNEILAVLEP